MGGSCQASSWWGVISLLFPTLKDRTISYYNNEQTSIHVHNRHNETLSPRSTFLATSLNTDDVPWPRHARIAWQAQVLREAAKKRADLMKVGPIAMRITGRMMMRTIAPTAVEGPERKLRRIMRSVALYTAADASGRCAETTCRFRMRSININTLQGRVE